MSLRDDVRAVRRWAPSQRWLRAVVLLGPAVGVASAAGAGQTPPVWLILVAVVLGAVAALRPDTPWPLAALVLVPLWWTYPDGRVLHPTALVAALAVVVTHVAATVAAQAPPTVGISRAVLALWLRRGAVLSVCAVPVWLLAELVAGQPAVPGLWVTALLLATAAVAGGATLLLGTVRPGGSARGAR